MPKLIVPGVRDDEPEFVCTVPVNADGDTCGHLFYPGEERAYQKHVGKCAREHIDVIRAASPRTRNEIFEPWDPEVAAHMEKVGKRMIEERRLEVKPSERAGFS